MRRAIWLWLAAFLALAPAGAKAASFAIRDVRLFDGHTVRAHRTVVVSDGVIVRVLGPGGRLPPRAVIIDGSGDTLLPGLIDAHAHVSVGSSRPALAQAARLGVTTVLDMGTWGDGVAELRQAQAAGADGLADVRTAGNLATAPGGHPTEMLPGVKTPTLHSPAEAQAFVDARVAEGASYIKIVLEDCSEFRGFRPCPTLDDATLRALVAAAHRRGRLAIVHAEDEARARQAILAGADGLAHLFVGDRVGPGFGRLARAHRVFVTPTLSALYLWCGRARGASIAADRRLASQIVDGRFRATMAGFPQPAVASCQASDEALRQLRDAGVPILLGTDAPIPGIPFGAGALDEMSALVSAGLTPIQALTAATSAPAKAFRLGDRGEIRPGRRADLVLVRGDPTRDIDAARDIEAVWVRGVKVERF